MASRIDRCVAQRPWPYLAAIALLLPLASAVAVERDEARALSRDDGRLLYRETHWRDTSGDAARRVVLYRCPDGTAFARKSVLDRGNAEQPDFHYVDARSGDAEGVRTRAGRREVFVERKGATEARALPTTASSAVIDAGFDAAVRTRWTALATAPQQLAFLLPERFAFMPMRVSSAGDADGVRRLRMTVDRWFGFVAPSIELHYGLEDRRLREFLGPGTVRDARGRPRDVRIVFAPGPAAVASRGDLDAALADPLDGRCDT